MIIECHVNDGVLRLTADRAVSSALHTMGQQALEDCNFYCKKDMGALQQSALDHSDLTPNENGEIVLRWVEPYAEDQYDYPGTRTDQNPNACPRWCDVAENNHKREWEQLLVNELRRGGLG
ncbi:MAG: minor capsid protein [Oscillospiraceae bacterium]|nr:minor capsid protein [Oscillospiraceae bacterium]